MAILVILSGRCVGPHPQTFIMASVIRLQQFLLVKNALRGMKPSAKTWGGGVRVGELAIKHVFLNVSKPHNMTVL